MGKLVAQVPNEDPERLKRVLDAKWRTIGIDKDALEQQVDERRQREADERSRDKAFAELSQYFDDQLVLQQQEADRLRRQGNQNEVDFRNHNQLYHTRREWDLNRPDHKKMDAPARVGDDDPRLGPSSLQKFDGEDLSAGDRKAAQMEQARRWWEEQGAQKAAMLAAEKEAEQAHAELMRYQDMVQRDAAAQEANLRREMNKATLNINGQLAEERRLRDGQRKESELAANMAEVEATLASAMMTEDPMTAASAMSPYRVRKDHYKGMTETERRAIQDTQLAQIEEMKARRAAQELEELVYAKSQADIHKALTAQAQRVDDFKKTQLKKAQDVLKRQMEEKAERDKHLAELNRNKIDPTFFTQFGTSHR